jgi:CBS domain-containing protein
MNISDILRWKSSNGSTEVFTISPDDSITDLLRTLAERNVGALVVVEGGGVIGVVSERDVVRRLGAAGSQALEQPVRDIMTTSVLSCTSGDTVDAIAETMTQRRIRHMPVMDGTKLVGIVSIGDVVSQRIRQLETDRGQLEQYISG